MFRSSYRTCEQRNDHELYRREGIGTSKELLRGLKLHAERGASTCSKVELVGMFGTIMMRKMGELRKAR